MVDALASGASVPWERGGSSPLIRTNFLNLQNTMNSPIDIFPLALRVSKKIVNDDPLLAFRDMNKPFLHDIRDEFNDYVIRKCDLSVDEITEMGDLIESGFDATTMIVTESLKRSNRIIKKDKALRIATNDGTVETLGIIARQEPSIAVRLVKQASLTSSPYVVNYQDEYISFPHPNYQSIHPTRRCPAVIAKGSETISPAFSNFVKWSGALAVHSMYKRRRVN